MALTWPWMSKSKHEAVVSGLRDEIDAEYNRAYRQISHQVKDWAVEANYNVYNAEGSRARAQAIAAFQDAIGRWHTGIVPRIRKDSSELVQ